MNAGKGQRRLYGPHIPVDRSPVCAMKCLSLAQVHVALHHTTSVCGGLVKTAVSWLYHPACGDLVPATGVALRVGGSINQNQLHNSSDSSSAQEQAR